MTDTTTAFRSRYGFAREDVTLRNWRESPFSRWSFDHVSELVPSAIIGSSGQSETEPLADASALLAETVALPGGVSSIGDFLAKSSSDALVVMKAGRFIADHHAAHRDPAGRHLVFSISKSLTAIVAGALQDQGLLDPQAPVTDYVPELAVSPAYSDVSVQDLLDMRVSVDIPETYLDPLSAYGRYRRAMLWNPPLSGEVPETMLDLLSSLGRTDEPHGDAFRYRSPNSDLLGIIVERASGMRYADALGDLLWRGVGARSDGFVTVDRVGIARAAGGISMTARDLARVGEMMRHEGADVVSRRWVEDTLRNGDRDAWLRGDFPYLLPSGRYRNKWYSTGETSGAFCAIGIHGQWLYVDPSAEVVIVRFASQPIPVDDPLDLDVLALFRHIAASA